MFVILPVNMSYQVDEVIIQIVGETQFLYYRGDPDFENVAMKQKKWQEISSEISKICNIQMSALDVEKRWATLRDMSGWEYDRCAKRRRIEQNELIEKELVVASSVMAKAASSILELIKKNAEAPRAIEKPADEFGGFVLGLQASLKLVDDEDKLDCVIEMLQVAQRYQRRPFSRRNGTE